MIVMRTLNDGIQKLMNYIEELVLGNAKMAYAGHGIVMNFDASGKQEEPQYATVAQLAKLYPAFTQGSIRWLIFNESTNGFSKVIRRIGRKVIINLQEFRKYMSSRANDYVAKYCASLSLIVISGYILDMKM